MTRALRFAALGALLASGGCSFDSAEPGPVVVNSCNMTMECVPGSDCVNGMCIAQKADQKLMIALEVKPLRLPDGSDPLPIILPPFEVTAPLMRPFPLPEPIRLHGFVRSLATLTTPEVPLEADITFTPVETIRGIESKVISVASTPTRGSIPLDPDFTVTLLRDRQYRMVVRPRDATLPPRYEMVRGGGPDPRVEYVQDQLFARSVVVKGGATGRTLRVRALSLDTAEPISSTVTLDDKGRGTLRFMSDPGAFTVEIRSETPYTTTTNQPPGATNNDRWCDGNAPSDPVFTAHSDDLPTKDDFLQVDLPVLPAHIMFEGDVTACDMGLDAGPPDNLAISLHTADLLADDNVLAAAFEASTTATYNAATRSLEFCVEVIPAQHYVLLATPASTMPCALLNEVRAVIVPEGMVQPVTFMLPEAAYLSATLRTMDSTPLRGAAIDAIAIGTDEVRYNRSRPTATDADGSFRLQVDLGTYDVVIKPAPGSGLPWQVRHNVDIGKADELATFIEMDLPLTVQGSLAYRGSSTADPSLKDAVVAAYAVIKDGDSERAVPIGSATADENGRFTLLLPPSIREGWWPTR